MKKILSLIMVTLIPAILVVSCKKSTYEDSYANPSLITNSSVEKQYTGMMFTNREYVVPSYWNYFVVLRTSVNHYIQAAGWVNAPGQYVPGSAGITDRWNNYYNFLTQYRELQKLYGKLTAEQQAEMRVFMLTATIYFYDHTQKIVDLHGDIPWAEAGMLSTNNGNYSASYAKYQNAEDIYTTMLDNLQKFSDELNTLVIPAALVKSFETQDLVNKGNLTLWKRYCNSLRLRMLNRVSGTTKFQARASQEMGAIFNDPAKYPVVTTNDETIALKVFDLGSDINAKGFRTGLEDWNGNIAGKVTIDRMKTTADPRLRAMYEPGEKAGGVYNGLDQTLNGGTQTDLINGGTIAIYNRSTLSRNEFFPGVLISAAEVSYLKAEYYLRAGNDGAAKTAYEAGIKQSVNYYYWLRSFSKDGTSPALVPTNDVQIAAYTNHPLVLWTAAPNNAAKLRLIATEKWLHYGVVQPLESWAEIRRMDAPVLTFQSDNSSAQKLPPNRWIYPSSEVAYNTANYQAVQAKDNLQTKIFWDVN
ncbi:MAG TPA: SusD/RagB family nutrient-binding outer membrane lipoprotein [Pedobacter sp.]|uniref:SusD/RagB family nutrient-binding outer membrane lipoprotein n=1 Tax=Pedobacter sp. TaxID=1411316 RepID=UPI002C7FB70F|nr:SusD/RagB family nutrient-binding outer membrane lipoprotein [Pedobacter sp.]HMI02992.1 SusD/RagB family nutrient-binding outer membrane lipoprotein [Pedobacter sp.]